MSAIICLASAESALRGAGEDRSEAVVDVSPPATNGSTADVERASSSTVSLVASAAKSTGDK